MPIVRQRAATALCEMAEKSESIGPLPQGEHRKLEEVVTQLEAEFRESKDGLREAKAAVMLRA